MATIIDSLLITLGLDSSGLNRGIDQVQERVGSTLGQIGKMFAAYMGTAALSGLISDYANAADALGKFSSGIRENINDVQAWSSSIDAAGLDSGAFQGTLATLDKQLRDIGRRGLAGSFELRRLGVAARDSNGQVKTATEILEDLAHVADKMNPHKFKRYAESLGVDENTIYLLQKGSAEVGRLVSKYKDLSYTQQDANTAREFTVSMGDLNKAFKMFMATGLRLIVPALAVLADKFSWLINFLRKHDPFVKAFITGISSLLLRTLLPALAKAAAAGWAMIAPFLPFILIVAAIALLFDDLWAYIKGGTSALGDFWSIFGTGEEISETLGAAWEDLKAIGSALWQVLTDGIKVFFSYFGPALSSLGDVFKNTLKLIKELFTGDFDSIVNALMNLFSSLGTFLADVFVGVFTLIYNTFKNIFTGIGNFFGGILDGVLDHATKFIKDLVAKIPEFMLPESIIKWAKDVDKAVAEVGSNMAATVAPNAYGATQGVSPAAIGAGGSVDYSSQTTVHVGGVTVKATSTDPAGIARETGDTLRKFVNAGNKGVKP